ncbi:MAG: iron ABC transporter permease [Deltaproteobacteria bacterium]|nr:iron ABC transporter permease [Deltaproteobacteria bacterium]
MRPRGTLVLTALLPIALLAALALGPVLTVGESLAGLFGTGDDSTHVAIVRHVRLPRILVASIVGGALGAAGAALQGLFRNPLADPSVLGVSGSAALVAQLAIFFGWATLVPLAIPVAAVIGALLATLLLARLLARARGSARELLLLAGVALTQLAAAGSALVVSLSVADYSRAQRMMAWLLGSLDGRTWTHVLWGAGPLVLLTFVLHRKARELDALALGEATALSLGVDVPRLERQVILSAAVLSGLSVAVAGIVGFVGLVVPHLVRRLSGASHRTVLVQSALLGSLFLVASDALARRLLAPAELPVGVVTSAIGAPWFAFLLFRRLGRVR